LGYVICRIGLAFKKLLTHEFPARWGNAAQAIVYPTKGDAERIRQRITGERTAVLDAKSERIEPSDR
jgi:hypothetical protein